MELREHEPHMTYENFVTTAMLKWYDQHHRQLPWRANPFVTPNPYHVYLSEIMLQQTTVPTVINYFHKFIQLWPNFEALAQASQDQILHAWQGLGYYSRARCLYKCAQQIYQDYDNQLPKTPKELEKLPGIGPYTSASIAAIAFDYPCVPVDGNIARVYSRFHAIQTPLLQLKNTLHTHINHWAPQRRSGDFAQALMDLGSAICTPRAPKCTQCPLHTHCQAYQKKLYDHIPVKDIKKTKPTRHGYVYIVHNPQGHLLFVKREQKLLNGLMSLPTTEWLEDKSTLEHLNFEAIEPLNKQIKHTFTHFHLILDVFTTKANNINHGMWIDNPQTIALPTLMKKVLKLIK